ncbi:MAG: tripartite tricarboxylate transporter permease [Nanoarchaeota archaeon]|nr:tripartite tricarboxylate transporter permease [Nanoarchaeota archaeon]
MFDLILWAILGTLFGTFAGFLPGIHPNTIAAFIAAGSITLGSPLSAAAFLSALAVSNAITDFVPSIFFGAPDGETALSVLPGHKMLQEGRGYEAVGCACAGGLVAALFVVGLTPFLLVVLPTLYTASRSYLGFVLLGIAALLLFFEKPGFRLRGLTILFLAGAFGFIALSSPLVNREAILFPVFTGLFGLPTLIIAGKGAGSIAKQRSGRADVGKLRHGISGVAAGLFVGVLPGVGSAEASVLIGRFSRQKEKDTKAILVGLGSVSSAAALFSLLALVLIGRTRSGIAVALQKLFPAVSSLDLPVLLGSALFGAGISVLIALFLSRRLGTWLSGRDLGNLSRIMAIVLVCMVAVLTGPVGLFIAGIGVAIGLLPVLWGTRRGHAMGVLLLPTMAWALERVIFI